jgi:hypothetical protein
MQEGLKIPPDPKPIVLIPVHKAMPTSLELISLRQCGKCLAARDVFLLAPIGLDLGTYRELITITGEIRVQPHWMESIRAYNRLMIAPLIYDRLQGYTHLLVHEPDALVLRDELDYWCRQPFDYIGAPWFEGYGAPAPDAPLIGVGNFGFSLHRLQSINKAMISWHRWYPFEEIGRDLIRGLLGQRSRLQRAIRATGPAGYLRGAWQLYTENCDLFWSCVVPRVVPAFSVAPITTALQFAWEVLPNRCYDLCEGKLPFGIHGWAKHDLPFLTPLLKASCVDLGEHDESQTAILRHRTSGSDLWDPQLLGFN